MSFSAGTYTLPAGNPVVTATTITSTWANTTLSDIATALSTCVLKDGTQTITANIPMSNFKITGLGAGTLSTDAANINNVVNGTGSLLTGVAGTNTITAGALASFAYTNGQRVILVPAGTNTGATTLNITPSGGVALGAKNIFAGNSALVGGELHASIPVMLMYDGTQFQALGPIFRQPTRSVLTTGTAATYTTPTGATRIDVQCVGGGSGGMGGNGGTNSGAATATTFSDGTVTLSAGGGAAGVNTGTGGTATAASATGGDINLSGTSGGQGSAASVSGSVVGAAGACSIFGGGGASAYSATATGASVNTGSAGAGGAASTAGTTGGASGNSGAYCRKLIKGPSATYTYTVGAASNGTSGGAGAQNGGNGAVGIIIVDEFYD